MAKLDTQGRLLIPYEFRHELITPKSSDIAFCLESKKIFLVNKKLVCDSDNILAIRKLDSKGRIIIPKEVLQILNATKDSFIIICIYKNRICIQT